MRRIALMAALLLLQAAASAQSAKAKRDSLGVRVSAMKLAIAHADSSGPSEKAVEARLELASMVKDKEAIPLLDAAAALSDSVNDPWLEGKVRVALSKRLSAMGNHKRANAELLRALELGEADAAANAKRQAMEAADWIAKHLHERDSLITSHQQALSLARMEAGLAQKAIATREWMITAAAVLAIIMAVLLLVQRRSHRRAVGGLRQEMEGLRARIGEMSTAMEALQRGLEQAAAATPAPSPAPPAAAERAAAAHDPMVAALFRQQAPLRLAALRSAHAAADNEKVLRVLHSLRPQLDALDPTGLGALCQRLRSTRHDDAAWDPGLDELERGINTLLARLR